MFPAFSFLIVTRSGAVAETKRMYQQINKERFNILNKLDGKRMIHMQWSHGKTGS